MNLPSVLGYLPTERCSMYADPGCAHVLFHFILNATLGEKCKEVYIKHEDIKSLEKGLLSKLP